MVLQAPWVALEVDPDTQGQENQKVGTNSRSNPRNPKYSPALKKA